MNITVLNKTYTAPDICEKTILHYAGCKENGETYLPLDECIKEAEKSLVYKVCYCELPVTVTNEICDFKVFKLHSKSLATTLANCNKAILFAATIGVGIDRLITRYSNISPAKALLYQAIGTERIEALCDTFCEDMSHNSNGILTHRFSAGYGDLPLQTQTAIFKILQCEKKIGLTLNTSMLMSPTKSVTAFVGIKNHTIKT